MPNPQAIASLINSKWQAEIEGGIVIANPIPQEYAMDYDLINDAINKAVKSMNEEGITGYQQTPYLLKTVKDNTGGKSLDANIQLVYNNAKLAAQIAVEYAKKQNIKSI
jgi:pseudouridine-5'-phosphate glycosidase